METQNNTAAKTTDEMDELHDRILDVKDELSTAPKHSWQRMFLETLLTNLQAKFSEAV
jgi:hypothetical protein